eukprot:TRINITY_DN54248_c0_g1_i1.p1 TRINITY_DN54248_c0_g1~~TRINITY_DN54248_c0_g1_i1.p1  ORF type:complete len:849 (-),score=208.92 TRINITY_DN54248_c0_g1_i1:52-2598(-)
MSSTHLLLGRCVLIALTALDLPSANGIQVHSTSELDGLSTNLESWGPGPALVEDSKLVHRTLAAAAGIEDNKTSWTPGGVGGTRTSHGDYGAAKIMMEKGKRAKKNVLEEDLRRPSIDVIMGINRNAAGDILALESSIMFNATGWLVCIVFFCCMLRVYPDVYRRRSFPDGQSKEREAEVPPTGVWSKIRYYTAWMRAASGMDREEAMALAGLDGAMFLEYHLLMQRILFCLAPVIIVILCPIHYFFGLNTSDVDILGRLGINNLPNGSPCFWVHVGFVWYVVVVVVLNVLDAQHRFVRLRHTFLSQMPAPRATTVMVEHIPHRYRTDLKLRAFFENMFGKGAIESAFVVRRVGVLHSLQQQIKALTAKLEVVKIAAIKQGSADAPVECAKLQSALDAEKEKLSQEARKVKAAVELEEEHVNAIPEVRDGSGGQGRKARAKSTTTVATADASALSASGFVTFSSRAACRAALREQYTLSSDEFVVSCAPDPSDVNYSNLSLGSIEQSHLDLLGKLSMVAIFILWAPAVFAISGLTSIRTLESRLSILDPLLAKMPQATTIIEGILSTVVLKSFMALLPTLFSFIFSELFVSTSGSMAQYQMQLWYFVFNVVFVVLVTAIGRSVIATAEVILEEPSQVFEILAVSMPTSSHFYLQYIVLGWVAVAIEQLRLPVLSKYIAFRTLYAPDEAKLKSEPENQAYYGMGARFAHTSTYATIVLSFCTCAPLICVFSLVYFVLAYQTYTYLLCFAETKKPDLGGLFWVQALRQLFVGLVLFVFLMVGVLEQRAGTVREGFVAAASLLVVCWCWRKLNNFNWEFLSLSDVIKYDMRDGNKPTSESSEVYKQHLLDD